MPSYVLHVGPHKTGSTYLQSMFTRSADALAARGILYPTEWGSLQGHFPLADLLMNGDMTTLAGIFDWLNASDSGTILLSSENFSFLDTTQIANLRTLLGDAPVTIVFYCRRPTEVLPSTWREVVKHGVMTGLPGFVTAALTGKDEAVGFDFCRILDRFAAVFGPAALRLVSYNAVMDTGQDLFVHFCRSFLDCPDPPMAETARLNQSLNMVDAEMVRAMNAMEWGRARDQGLPLYKRFMMVRPKLDLRPILDVMKVAVDSIDLDETTGEIDRLHDMAWNRYGEHLIHPLPHGGLFPPGPGKLLYIDSRYLMADGVIENLRAIHKRLLVTPEPDPIAFNQRFL